MDVFDCIESRRSVRSYERKDVPNELLSQVLTAGTLAPSAGNSQEWEFLIIRDTERKRKLSEAALHQAHVRDAPVVIVVLANEEKIGYRFKERGKQVYAIQDTAACIQNMLLVAHDLGLGACWVGAFDEDEVRDVTLAPNHCRPVGLITLGFPMLPLPKTDRITTFFDRITWEEEYGQQIKWSHSYQKESRHSWKPLNQQIEELTIRLQELRKEKKKLEKKESGLGFKLKKAFSKKK
ncbi:MAG: nitroreductase family protein [Candidatus Aenigmarchaeota archaeon]|nr:nitroreductase family protein [Candidatus Aenigmarchaeota archaeon]